MYKVIHIISDTNIGGAGRYLLNLLRAHNRKEFAVKVACPSHGLLANAVRNLGVEVLPLPEGEKSFSLRSMGGLTALLQREKPHVVHTHASLSGRVAARLAGVPVIVLTRHGIGSTFVSVKRKMLTRFVSRFFTDGVIAVSEAVKEALLAQGVPSSIIRVIYNGINLDECMGPVDSLSVQQEFALGDGPVIGVIARLTPEKGHKYFLQSLPAVLKVFPTAKALFVGAGSCEKELRGFAKSLQLQDAVVFAGYREDVLAIIETLNVSVLPSVTEGLGLVLLESMARGKPVVASRTGGIPEVVEDGVNGILVPPGNPEKLAEAVLSLLQNDSLARSMGENGKIILKEKFAADKMAAATESFYRELLGIRDQG